MHCAASRLRCKRSARRSADVVRTRMYVTDISLWRDVGAVHAEVFGDIRPVATMVEVSALIAPELLVEIEVDAYVADLSRRGRRERGRPHRAGTA